MNKKDIAKTADEVTAKANENEEFEKEQDEFGEWPASTGVTEECSLGWL